MKLLTILSYYDHLTNNTKETFRSGVKMGIAIGASVAIFIGILIHFYLIAL